MTRHAATRVFFCLTVACFLAAARVVDAATTVRVATWNIATVGAPFTPEYDAALATLNRIDADIVGINAVDGAADVTNLQALAADAGYANVVAASGSPFGSLRCAFMVRGTLPILESMEHSSASLSGDTSANDISHLILSIKVDVAGVDRDLSLVIMHWKSGTSDTDEFRRAIESRRIAQALDSIADPGDAIIVMGDVEEEITAVPQAPNPFTMIPAELVAPYVLGSDLTASLPAPGIVNDPFANLRDFFNDGSLVTVPALQLDGTEATRPASGRRLDYIFVSPVLNGPPPAETYDSADEGLGGLPKSGSPLPPSTSSDASDHLLVFADVSVPALPRAEPRFPTLEVRTGETKTTARWDPVDDLFGGQPFDRHYEVSTDEDFGGVLFGEGAFSARSDVDPGFRSVQNPADAAPFSPDDGITFDLPSLTNGGTFWWRVRSREDSSSTWGPWSEPWSFTVDSTLAPPAPFGDWYQTTTNQFLRNQFDNAMSADGNVTLLDEFLPGTIQTPLIALEEIQVVPYGGFNMWKRATVSVTHPDEVTSVEVEVYDELDMLINTSGPHSGLGAHDVTVPLTGIVQSPVYIKITMTPGSTPVIHSINLQGDETTATSVAAPAALLTLDQNVPNPFNPSTRISFTSPRAAHVNLTVFDVTGRRVATLVDEFRGPGRWLVPWNGTSATGVPVASGVFYYRLRIGNDSIARKMVVVR